MERKLKDSGIPWIGAIPEHWEVTKIAKICYEHYVTNKIEHNQNLLSLSYGNIKRKDINTVDGLLPASFDTYQIVDKGNIVLRLTDLQNDKRSLRVGHVGERGIITSAYVALGMKPYVYSKYMYFLLHTADICKVFYTFGGGVRQGGKWDDVASLAVPVPPLSEQEAISAYLDEKCGEIDELIEVEQKMIADLESYRQAVITEAVTHGLNPDVPLRDSGIDWIPQIPVHWEIHYLRGIANSFRKGSGITKDDLIPVGDISCIRYGDLYTKYKYHVTDVICRTNLSKIQTPVFASYGDIYFTCSGEDVNAIGKSVAFLSNEDCLIGGDLIIMKHSQNPKFLGYSLDSIVSQKQKSYGKSKLKVVHTSVKDLKNVVVALPPFSEQQAIADYLDAKCAEIAELIKVKQDKIESLKQYRQSLIFEAVTGKININ